MPLQSLSLGVPVKKRGPWENSSPTLGSSGSFPHWAEVSSCGPRNEADGNTLAIFSRQRAEGNAPKRWVAFFPFSWRWITSPSSPGPPGSTSMPSDPVHQPSPSYTSLTLGSAWYQDGERLCLNLHLSFGHGQNFSCWAICLTSLFPFEGPVSSVFSLFSSTMALMSKSGTLLNTRQGRLPYASLLASVPGSVYLHKEFKSWWLKLCPDHLSHMGFFSDIHFLWPASVLKKCSFP